MADQLEVDAALARRLVALGANVARARTAVQVPEGRVVDTDRYFAFWDALGALAPADLGLRLARETSVHEYDIAHMAALHSHDVRASLEKIARYKRLCGPKDLLLEERARELRVHVSWLHARRPVPARLVDGTLATLLVLLQRGTGRELVPVRIELVRRRGDEPMLRRFFGCSVHFEAARDALVLSKAQLELPYVTHNADLVAMLVPGLEAKLRRAPSLLDQVRAAVGRRMAGERPSVQKVARDLALSARTLQRRLGELGTSYQRELDGARHDAALRLLRASELDIPEVAFLLGFEELNSFTRAFREWEGTTPRRWRALERPVET